MTTATQPLPRTSAVPGRLDTLTALRYPAALAVVLSHVFPHFINLGPLQTASQYGYVGVSFFFMLSGFVLTWAGASQSHWNFWRRRIARIFPLTLLVTLLAFLLFAHYEYIPGPWAIVQNYLLLQAWNPHLNVYFAGNGVTWSLSCEAFFYLLFPFIIGPVSRLSRRGLVGAVTLTMLALAIPPLVVDHTHVSAALAAWLFFILPPYRFGEFLLGMLVARAVRCGVRIRLSLTVVVASLGVAVVAAYTIASGTAAERPYVALLLIPGFGLILMQGAVRDIAHHSVKAIGRPLVWLGEWSFSLYLIHQLFFRITKDSLFNPSQGLGGVLGLVVYVALATGIAAICCYAIEKPCIRLIARKRRGGGTLPATIPSAA